MVWSSAGFLLTIASLFTSTFAQGTASSTSSQPVPTPSCYLVQSKHYKPSRICGDTGVLRKPASPLQQWTSANGYSDCGISCHQDAGCASFAYDSSSGACQTFSKQLIAQGFEETRESTTYYWNKNCFKLKCSAASTVSTAPSSSSSSSSLMTSSTAVISSTSVPSTTSSPTTFNTANYTYYQVTLPTFTTTFPAFYTTNTSAGNYFPTKTPSPTCIMDAAKPQGEFQISTNDNIPIIPGEGGFVQFLTASMFPNTSQAANEAFFNSLPSYQFKAVPAAAPYLDAFVMNKGSKSYVGFDVNTGVAILSPSSSEGQTPIQVRNYSIVTTVFTFTCEGFISIVYNDETYQWQTSASNQSLSAIYPGENNSTNNLLLVPLNLPSSLVDAAQNGNVSRRGVYDPACTEGELGRCPNNPSGLYAKPRPGVRPMQFNGCGSDSTAQYIPQFDFGQCCDNHDYCYDNCATGEVELCTNEYCAPGWWEGCNNMFYQCMANTACDPISWWDPIEKGGCYIAANFYAWVVTTYLGADAFTSADSDRCGVYCEDNSPYCYGQCAGASNNGNCGQCGTTCDTANNFGCVNNTCVCTADILTDNNNCGNCGWVCPFKTYCNEGTCACDDEQCGDVCVDTQSNPNHCGACGNSCGSGYCFEGQCQTIPTSTSGAPVCYPTDAVQNGGFDQLDSSGEAEPWLTLGTIYYENERYVTSPPNAAEFAIGASVYQNMTLCSNSTYQLTFTLGLNLAGDLETFVAGQAFSSTQYCSLGEGICSMSYQVNIPPSPAGNIGTTSPDANWNETQYDPSGSFAYTQLYFHWAPTEYNKFSIYGAVIDTVSLVQI